MRRLATSWLPLAASAAQHIVHSAAGTARTFSSTYSLVSSCRSKGCRPYRLSTSARTSPLNALRSDPACTVKVQGCEEGWSVHRGVGAAGQPRRPRARAAGGRSHPAPHLREEPHSSTRSLTAQAGAHKGHAVENVEQRDGRLHAHGVGVHAVLTQLEGAACEGGMGRSAAVGRRAELGGGQAGRLRDGPPHTSTRSQGRSRAAAGQCSAARFLPPAHRAPAFPSTGPRRAASGGGCTWVGRRGGARGVGHRTTLTRAGRPCHPVMYWLPSNVVAQAAQRPQRAHLYPWL